MAVFFDCPFCSYDKKVPDSYYNKKLKCPRCLATITLGLEQPSALTALPLPEEDISPLEQTAIEVDKSDTIVECPYCFQLIGSEENICPYCHKTVSDTPFPKKVFLKVSSLEKKIQQGFYLGLASLLCGFGVLLGPLAIFLGIRNFQECQEKEREMVYAGLIMGVFGFIGSSIFVAGLF